MLPFLDGDLYKCVDEMFLHCTDTKQLVRCVRTLNEKLKRYRRILYVDEITTIDDNHIVASLIVANR